MFGNRRNFVATPKRKFRGVDDITVFSRSFKGRLRNIARDNRGLVQRVQNNRCTSRDFFVLDIRDLMEISCFDLDHGFVKFGKSLITYSNGTCQGSPLSVSVCCTVCIVIEFENGRRFGTETTRIWSRWMKLWIDDIFVFFHFVCPRELQSYG